MEGSNSNNNVVAANNQEPIAAGQQQHHRKKRYAIENTVMAMIFFGISIFLIAYGICQLAVASARDHNSRHAWAFVVNGIFCLIVGLHGFFLIFHKRSSVKHHVCLNIILLVQALVLFIIYSALLHRYIKEDCGGDFYQNPYCVHDLKVYLGISLAIFWVINIFVFPFSLICSIIHMKAVTSSNNNSNNNA